MKKLFVTLLCLVMVAVCLPTVAFADTMYFAVTVDGETTEYATAGEAVESIPADATAMVKLLADYEGGGLSIKGQNMNITFDLNGKTWTVTEPPVGSAGTETNGFQLLAGNTITFKNGTIATSEATKAKLLIQNYCDLTLEDVTVDVTDAPEALIYGVSHNNGTLQIVGSSSIYAPGREMAFDAMYWPANGYGEVNIIVDTTGTIDGKIMYGSDGSEAGKAGVAEMATITIKNANVTDEFVTYLLADDDATGITLEGGTFASIPGNVTKAADHEATITVDGVTKTVLGLDKINDELSAIPADKVGDYEVELVKAAEGAQLNAPAGVKVKNSSGNDVKLNDDELADGDELVAKVTEPEADEPAADEQTPATETTVPKTGDVTNAMPWMAVMILAGVAAVVLKKREQ